MPGGKAVLFNFNLIFTRVETQGVVSDFAGELAIDVDTSAWGVTDYSQKSSAFDDTGAGRAITFGKHDG